jgi:hypothetical protein
MDIPEKKSYVNVVKKEEEKNDLNMVHYKIKHEYDEQILNTYHLKKEDWESSIRNVTDKIKNEEGLNNCYIKYEHSSFDIKEDHQPIKETQTMNELKAKSSNDVVLVNFVSSLTDKFNNMEENVRELQQSNQIKSNEINELKQSMDKLKNFTLYPLLIRQLRKEAKERIIKSSGLKSNDYADSCNYLRELISKKDIKELDKIGILKWFDLSEVQDLFNDKSYNYELNCVAHPRLSEYKEDIYQLGQFNKKMYDYIFN